MSKQRHMRQINAFRKGLSVRALNLMRRIDRSKKRELTYCKGGGWMVDAHAVAGCDVAELERAALLRQTLGHSGSDNRIYELCDDAKELLDKTDRPLMTARQGK